MEMISVSPVLHEAWKGRPFSCGHWERGGSYTAEIEDGPIAHFGLGLCDILGVLLAQVAPKKNWVLVSNILYFHPGSLGGNDLI